MAHCFTPIRGRRMRVTKVNSLGRPVYGANSFVVTGGFVSVQFTPQVQEGEEITVRTADGSLCVSERGCDELQWIQVQIEFCQVDPCLFTLINETWTELRDCVGEVIGWAESYKFSCDSGFALELWTDVTGYTPTTPGAQGAWGYMLLPFIVGGTLGEQTVENGAVSFTITGRTKKGSGWGMGPYNVMCNDATTGACGPLLTPVGPEEPRRIMLTTCPPPAAACGCQPLSAPDGPALAVAENTGVASRMGVTAEIPAGTGTYRISWGDNSPVVDIVPGTPALHTYERPGTYHIAVWDTANTQKISVRTVTVPFSGGIAPTITVVQEGTDIRTARVTVTNPAAGRTYEVRWKASDPDFVDIPATGTPAHSITHPYTAADDGQVTITVRDKADPAKSVDRTITIPFPQAVTPTITVVEEPGDATHKTARMTVTNPVTGRDYQVQWEAGDPWQDVLATSTPAYSLVHPYTTANGVKAVTVRDKADTTKTTTQNITIPFPQPVTPTLLLTEESTADPRREIRVTVTNAVAGREYEALFEGSTWQAIPSTGDWPYSATHVYATDGAKTVQVRDKNATTSSAQANVNLPFTGLAFTLAQNGAGARDVRAEVIEPAAGVTYEIQWQAGGGWTDLAGTPPAGTNSYSADGTYAVTVRNKAATSTTATRQVHVPFAPPAGFSAESAEPVSPETTDSSTTARKRK